MNAIDTMFHSPIVGVALTVITYAVSLRLQRRWAWLHPLFLTSCVLMLIIFSFDISYEAYMEGGEIITFFLGPATVALAIPLYKQRHEIRKRILRIVGSISVGSAVGILSAWALISAFGGSRELLLASLPKSATSAISIELARSIGGSPEIAAVMTVLTGLIGSMMGSPLLRLCKLDATIPLGLAVGTSAHGIGTSRLVRDDEQAGSYAALAMGIAGIVISLMLAPLVWWMR